MEDLIILLIVGAIYFLRSMTKERDTTKQQTPPETPHEDAPQPGRQEEYYGAGKITVPDACSEASSLPTAHKEWAITTSPAPPRLIPKKRVDTVLRRYGAWQRAMIMHELLHPRHRR